MRSLSSDEVLALVGRIYDCVLQPDDWPGVLETVATSIGGLNASISVQDPISRVGTFSADWAVPPDAIRQYNEKYASLNPVLTSGWYCDIDEPISAAHYVGPDNYFRSRYAKEFLEPLGWGDAIGSHLAKMSSRYGILAIFAPWSKGPFEENEVTFVRTLSPHVRRAVHLSELLGPRDPYQTIEASTLDLLRAGVILVDAGKRIVFCNKAAEELVTSSPGISRKGDYLHLSDPITGNQIASAIDDALLAPAGAAPENGIPVTLGSVGAPPIAAWVFPLKRRSRIRGAETFAPKVAIFFQEIGQSAPLAGKLFVKQFAITPSECRVLVLLTQGHTPAAIAEWTGSSTPTIKTHLSRLFAKTGTKTQAQLVRLAMTALSPAQMTID